MGNTSLETFIISLFLISSVFYKKYKFNPDFQMYFKDLATTILLIGAVKFEPN